MKNFKRVIVCLIVIILILAFYKVINIKKDDTNIEKNKNIEILYTQNNSKLESIVDNVYTYGGNVLIKVNNTEYNFKEAIEKNIITIDELLNKAK